MCLEAYGPRSGSVESITEHGDTTVTPPRGAAR